MLEVIDNCSQLMEMALPRQFKPVAAATYGVVKEIDYASNLERQH